MVRVSIPPKLARAGGVSRLCQESSTEGSWLSPCSLAMPPIRSCLRSAVVAIERSTDPMKLIVAIIQPSRLEAVKRALTQVEVFRLTLMDVQGFGRQKGHTETFRGHDLAVNLLRKVRLEIAVNDAFVEPTIQAITEGGRTGDAGEIGDGKIFILPMDDCIRIRTGERGSEAI